MNAEAIVHPRVCERHPELTEQDVLDAWESCVRSVPRLDRDPSEHIAIGMDSHGRLIEMIARRVSVNTYLIFHAFAPPTRKALVELGMTKRR